MIFVQIAAYRDPEALPTIIDCIAKAKYPRDLRFGICWQKQESDHSLTSLKGRGQFRMDEMPWQESQGLCWARSRIQRLYEGEDYTIQLDSHHRFAQDWDATLLEWLTLTDSPKPIITTYAGIYVPKTNELKDDGPFMMVGERFSPSGTIPFQPHSIPGWRELNRPVRARFVSGHFFFTLGKHCEEYRYDPNLYFAGDEISLSIRSFTLGYDLFHPHRTLVWHEYTREGRVKHWDDHTTENKPFVGLAWHERDLVSKRRLRKLLREEENDEDLTGYDLGAVRTHRDYELYAGIDFARRRLQRATIAGIEPPNEYVNNEQWERAFGTRRVLDLAWSIEDVDVCDDLHFIYFGVESESGEVLFRYDAPEGSAEVCKLTNAKQVEVVSSDCPVRLVVWPVSKSQGWLRKVVYPL